MNAPLPPPSAPFPSPPVAPAKKSGPGKIIVIVGAVLLGAVALTLLTSNKNAAVTTAPSTTTSASVSSGIATTAGPAENQSVTVTGEALTPQPDSGTDASVGSIAPTLAGFDFTGKPVSLKPGDGKAKLIVFVAHWCPHCQREVPLLVAWQNDGSIPKSVDVVAISTAVAADRGNFPPSKWLAKEKWTSSVMADDAKSSAGAAYGLTGFPYFVVVDGTGKVVGRDSGEKDLATIQALLAKAVTA